MIRWKAAVLLLFFPGCAPAMNLQSDAPGNLFVVGQPVVFHLGNPHGQVTYELTDYFGQVIRKTLPPQGFNASLTLPPLPPGWYALKCTDSVEAQSTVLGVVLGQNEQPLPLEGRVCGDAGIAWLINREEYRPIFAQMVRLGGIPWVRERLSWKAVEPSEGRFNWGKFQRVADLFADQGVHVCQVFHDSPDWTHPGKFHSYCPDDLRTVYRFTRAAAAHFKAQISAWEIWNEPDLAKYWPDLSDRFAGFQKAACLGLKDGNPQAIVLQGSLSSQDGGAISFARGLYESGLGDYFETFNWHRYAPPSEYPDSLATYLHLLAGFGLETRPVWLTEAGIYLPTDEHRLLDAQAQRRQCRFVPKSVTMALVAGTDRYFFFMLPFQWRPGKKHQFGMLRPDLTPNPAFIALSAAANILGLSEYRGEFGAHHRAYEAHTFSTPQGNVVVAWAPSGTEMTIPTEKDSVRVANLFGQETETPTQQGSVTLTVGPNPRYVIDVGERIRAELSGSPRLRGKRPSLQPSRLILVGHCNLPVDKERNVYVVSGSDPFEFSLEVYNFQEEATARGVVYLAPPPYWQVEGGRQEVTLEPMGRKVLQCQLIPPPGSKETVQVVARAQFPGIRVAPSVSYFGWNPDSLESPPNHSLLQPRNQRPQGRWAFEASGFELVQFERSSPGRRRWEILLEEP